MSDNNHDTRPADKGTNTLLEQPLDHFLERSYRRYAILTILDRALPDARDGLKPVQRRILYAMYSMGMLNNTPHRKSARVVGEVLGKYHPHGDASVYDAMVRMAQDFTMREPLIDGQGNFGSIDGDSAAAMRYTEARLSTIGETLLADIEKDTVGWKPNFDGSLQEPVVLPTRFPNLLVNGSSGIAVGMSTNILPHNLGEVCDAVIYMANNWTKKDKITVDDLMKFIPGPDLPTGGLIYRYRVEDDGTKTDVIRQAYLTGNATIACQAKAEIKEIGGGKSEITVTELPYQVQKSTILERIASHKDKFAGLSDVRDESDFNGMRVVFEVARGADPEDVFQKLLTHTQMRNSLSHNALALIQQGNGNGGHTMPSYLSLSQMLQEFIKHRLDVITRRSQFELNRAEARLHIVQGLLKALSMIDEVIEIIRRSQTVDTARTNLMKKLSLDQIQAQAILDMPLRRLASLERKKLEEEKTELEQTVKRLKALLGSEKLRLDVLIQETNEIKEKFANPRKTIILDSEEGHQAAVTVSDLVIPQEKQMILLTTEGLERINAKDFRESVTIAKATNRSVKITLQRISAEPEDSILLVSSLGRAWLANVGRIPNKTTESDFGLGKKERIISIQVFKPDKSLVLMTKGGNIKRIKGEDLQNTLSEASWSMVIGLASGEDEVLGAFIVDEKSEVLIGTKGTPDSPPRILRFPVNTVNPQATPSARGVTAIKMLDDPLIGAETVDENTIPGSVVAVLTEKGYLKLVSLDEFPIQGRGGQGVLCYRPTQASGLVIGFTVLRKNDMIDILSAKNKRLRLNQKDIPLTNRPGKGIDLAAKYGDGKTLFQDDSIAGIIRG